MSTNGSKLPVPANELTDAAVMLDHVVLPEVKSVVSTLPAPVPWIVFPQSDERTAKSETVIELS